MRQQNLSPVAPEISAKRRHYILFPAADEFQPALSGPPIFNFTPDIIYCQEFLPVHPWTDSLSDTPLGRHMGAFGS